MVISLSLAAAALVLCEPFHDSENDLYGYLSCDGEIAIEARFQFAYEFTDGGIAAVMDESGWYYISKSGEFVIRPKIYDNGPDYFSDGLSRYVEDGKYGYFDESGKIVIEATYEFAWPFKDGKAEVGEECQFIKDGEHTLVECDARYYIDKPKNGRD